MVKKWGLWALLLVLLTVPLASLRAQEIAHYILFVSNRKLNEDIYILDLETNQTRNLTNNSAKTWHPTWSGDGLKIAYNSDQDGNEEIYVMEANGLDQHNVSKNPARDLSPDWSPTADEIAFISNRDGGFDLYVLNLTDNTTQRLTTDGQVKSEPDWSPDGKRIAFWQQEGSSVAKLNIIDVASGNVQTIVDKGQNLWPAWSPDGKKIAFYSAVDKKTTDIFTVDVATGEITNLTNSEFNNARPDWSSDGSEITFMSDRDGNFNIYVMSADGSDPRPMTNASQDDHSPSWQPVPAEIDFAANPTLSLGALEVQEDEIDPAEQSELGSGQRRLFAPEQANYKDVIRVRFEIELDHSTSTDTQATPAPTPDIPLRDQAALKVYRFMGAELTGLDLQDFDIFPNPTNYLLKIREDEVNYWEWLLRPKGPSVVGMKNLAVKLYLPNVESDGVVVQEQLELIPFNVEILSTEPETESEYVQETVESEPTQGFSVYYSDENTLIVAFSNAVDLSDMRIATEGTEFPVLDDFPIFTETNNEAPAKSCVSYEREGSDVVLPRACRGGQTYDFPLNAGDIFWYSLNDRLLLNVMIRKDGQVYICPAGAERCDF